MKNTLKDILNKIKSAKKKVFKKDVVYIDTNSYWRLLILLSFLIILTSLGFGYFLFNQISIDFNSSTENTGLVESINKQKLDETLEYFSNKENTFNTILNSPSVIEDPSL